MYSELVVCTKHYGKDEENQKKQIYIYKIEYYNSINYKTTMMQQNCMFCCYRFQFSRRVKEDVSLHIRF